MCIRDRYTKEIEHQGLRQIDISESWERLVATDPALLDCAVLHTDPEDVRVAAELRKQRRERGVGPGRQGQRLPPMVEWEATLGVWAVTWKSLGGEASVVPKPGWEAVVQEKEQEDLRDRENIKNLQNLLEYLRA